MHASSRHCSTKSTSLFLFLLLTIMCGPAAGMARMVSDVLSVLLAPTAPPTEGTLLSMCVRHALQDRPPCSDQVKLVPTAPLSACVMLAMAHLQGLHRNVQPVSAPSIRVSIAPLLLPHLKALSLRVFSALKFQTGRSPVMSMAGVRPTPTRRQRIVRLPMQPHPLVA
jgi:hypothetical protein